MQENKSIKIGDRRDKETNSWRVKRIIKYENNWNYSKFEGS